MDPAKDSLAALADPAVHQIEAGVALIALRRERGLLEDGNDRHPDGRSGLPKSIPQLDHMQVHAGVVLADAGVGHVLQAIPRVNRSEL
jgi:hypothetical protein